MVLLSFTYMQLKNINFPNITFLRRKLQGKEGRGSLVYIDIVSVDRRRAYILDERRQGSDISIDFRN